MCFYITLGSILAPFSYQSACFPAHFSSLLRSCSAKGALWGHFPPFGSTLVAFWHPFGSYLGSFPPYCLPFGRLRHAGGPFGSAGMLSRTLFLTLSFLFRKGFPLGSLSSSSLHFGRLLASLRLPFHSFWDRSATKNGRTRSCMSQGP
jgi:hypothetical protein